MARVLYFSQMIGQHMPGVWLIVFLIISKVVVDPRAKMVSASSWGSRGSFTFEVVAVVARRAPDRTRILRDRSSTHKVLLTFFEDDGERRSSTGYGLFHGSFFSSPNVQS
jgi:hypothetical protein